MKTFLLSLLLLMLCVAVSAQGFLRVNLDSAYIGKPKEDWTFKGRINMSGSTVRVEGVQDETKFSTDLSSDLKSTLSVAASYRGLSIGLALNPLKMLGRYGDFELNMNSYSNRYGIDVIYAKMNSYKGTQTFGDVVSEVDSRQVEQRMLTVNGYYAFNYKRFSYPAAFSQSQIQRKSCGSWLLGATWMSGYYDYSKTEDEKAKLQVRQLGLGGGYGYNFVISRRWLLHMSSVCEMVVYANDRIESADERRDASLRFPNFITIGRMALVYTYSNKFLGFTAVVNTNAAGSESKVHIENVKWRARLFYGIRISNLFHAEKRRK